MTRQTLTVSADWMRACWGLCHPVEMPIIREDSKAECVLGRCFVVDYGKRHWVVYGSRCDRVPLRSSKERHETKEQLDAQLDARLDARVRALNDAKRA